LLVLLFPCKEWVYQDEWMADLDSESRATLQPGWHWEKVRKFCQKKNLEYLDLGPALRAGARRGEQLYFPTDVHFNAAGHRTVAEELEAATDS
jgi:hypothetical protein